MTSAERVKSSLRTAVAHRLSWWWRWLAARDKLVMAILGGESCGEQPKSSLRRALAPRMSWCGLAVLACGVILLALTACGRGSGELYGWKAVQPGVELSSEEGAGPEGETVLALLYTVAPGQDYAIERPMPIPGLQGRPVLRLMAKATRVLHLAIVLVDGQGQEHECAHTLVPGDWRDLTLSAFAAIDDWAQVAILRLVDRTGGLGGQGPVSLKLVGLPLQVR